MPIKVRFRGPMLFVTDNPGTDEVRDVVDRVGIPGATPEVVTTRGPHGDGTTANPHWAALLLIEPGRPKVYLPLGGATVVIAANGASGAPSVSPEFLSVPPLHEMTNPRGASGPVVRRLPNPPLRGGTSIILQGGTMTGDLMTAAGVELPRHGDAAVQRPLCSMPVWDGLVATGTIRISRGDAGTEEIVLSETTEVYIYNWDTPFPIREDLMRTPVLPAQRFEDQDFKWVYDFLKPPQATWTEWLAQGSEPLLPAPRSANYLSAGGVTPAEHPTIGFCDSARWAGPVVM